MPDFTKEKWAALGRYIYRAKNGDIDNTVLLAEVSDENIQDAHAIANFISFAPEMYRLLWVLAERDIYYRKVFIHMLAKIYVEPDPDLNIPEELISQVKKLRKELNKHVQ